MEDLEEFIRAGNLWDPDELGRLIDDIVARADAADDDDTVLRPLAQFLRAVMLRTRMGDVGIRLRDDIEAVVYPRVWKLLEAARDGLPAAELTTRLQVMNRRLSRILANEAIAGR